MMLKVALRRDDGFRSILLYTRFDVAELFEGLTGMRPRWSGSLGRGRYGSWSTSRLTSFRCSCRLLCRSRSRSCVHEAVPTRVSLVLRLVRDLDVLEVVLQRHAVDRAAHRLAVGGRHILERITASTTGVDRRRHTLRTRRWLLLVRSGRGRSQRRQTRRERSDDIQFVGVEMYRELLFIIKAEEHGMSPEYGKTYFTQLVNPIPRALWPGKPVADAGLVLARAHECLIASASRRSPSRPDSWARLI